MNRFTLAALCGLIGITSLCGQGPSLFNQVIGTSGRTGSHQGRIFSYTVGEAVIWTGVGSQRVLTQGFHQPEHSRLVYVGEPTLSSWNIVVFPNPTAEVLNVRFSTEKGTFLNATVLDALGRVVLQGERLSDGSILDCRSWQAGIYFLVLTDPASRASATTRFIRL